MTEPGPFDHWMTPEPMPPSRRRWWLYGALALAVLAGALVVVVVLRPEAVRPEAAPKRPSYPTTWDQRVLEHVAFVEKTRNLTFAHPVQVDFLPDAKFAEEVTADRSELTDEDEADLESWAGVFRALGLVSGDVDLFGSLNQLSGVGIIGFYSYDDERLAVRGTEITPAVESTIVHELTHALQDQHFDLGIRIKELEKADEENGTATYQGFDVVVEGDANRIEGLWEDELGETERTSLEQEERASSQQFEKDAKDIPEVLRTMMGAPYALGEALLAVAAEQGGDDAVDDLFRSPPETEEHELDPWTLLADEQEPVEVPMPEVPEGAETFDDGAFGSVGWLLTLSQRIPVEQALTAVDGWGGDSYAAYVQDGVSCVTIGYRADTPDDLAEMRTALQAWAVAGPNGEARVLRDGDRLVFSSCDPGKDAPKVEEGRSSEALTEAVSRTYLSLTVLKAGNELPMARCVADRLVATFTMAELNDSATDPDRVAEAVAPCGAVPRR